MLTDLTHCNRKESRTANIVFAKKHKEKGNDFGFGLTDLNGISRTMSARYYKDGAEILIPQEDKNPRRLTPRECARLQGFPDSFLIPVSDNQAYKQFGNSFVIPLNNANLGVPLSGRAFRSNLLFVPHKRISTSIPNAKLAA
jgi:site-specific DNA-cytosine methylase